MSCVLVAVYLAPNVSGFSFAFTYGFPSLGRALAGMGLRDQPISDKGDPVMQSPSTMGRVGPMRRRIVNTYMTMRQGDVGTQVETAENRAITDNLRSGEREGFLEELSFALGLKS